MALHEPSKGNPGSRGGGAGRLGGADRRPKAGTSTTRVGRPGLLAVRSSGPGAPRGCRAERLMAK